MELRSEAPEGVPAGIEFRSVLEEWLKNHRLFAATLEELGGQLAALQPANGADASPIKRPSGSAAPGGAASEEQLLQRVLAAAPSPQLEAYAAGAAPAKSLQRSLPQQLDDNLRLLGVLAAEMRQMLGRMEQLADAAAAAALGGGGSSSGGAAGGGAADSSSSGDEALLLAAVLDGAAKETHMIETAAAGITLTTAPDEVAAAATVAGLQPFMDATLLATVQGGMPSAESQQQ